MYALLYFVIHPLIHSLIHSHLLTWPLLNSAPWQLWGYHFRPGVLLLLATLSSATACLIKFLDVILTVSCLCWFHWSFTCTLSEMMNKRCPINQSSYLAKLNSATPLNQRAPAFIEVSSCITAPLPIREHPCHSWWLALCTHCKLALTCHHSQRVRQVTIILHIQEIHNATFLIQSSEMRFVSVLILMVRSSSKFACYDSRVVVTCAKLWSDDQISIFHLRDTYVHIISIMSS